MAAAGIDHKKRVQWHAAFEVHAPEAHQDFLESLGIDDEEIKAIRLWSREENDRSHNKRVNIG
ncbi:hypothetical protein ACQZV8_14940 [Magnetococcales bacterium HHB-1]